MKIKRIKEMDVILDNNAYMPERAYETDAGMDLRTPMDVCIPTGKSVTIDTGVHLNIPAGWFGKLESKSGLHIKHDIVCLGGTIDAGYTGSIAVKLYNFSDKDYSFERGDKIVQLVLILISTPKLSQVKEFNDTDRGDDGFGSTGK